MPEKLNSPREISSLRRFGNLAIVGTLGIATFEAVNVVAEHTILPIFIGAIVAVAVFRFLHRSRSK